ncbi:tetratricopeptide repeat protein [Vagococcus sp. BWB3-3]|uniref:Tetratricopeptide repeat protein n=1 Tax=Vagococcus allomyrinae TaxID=2794353 RepID=A0A940P1I5_9ENTE|nr:tetratricopeptide repeat protein [Vagococcus allomyrinae]MBP1039739.1 tetratricopeptide repeat protein [Vagococcus allomyrinae]
MTLKKAIELREAGQALDSCELLKRLVEKQPDSAELNYHCAWSHDVAGLEQEAVPFYEQAIALGQLSEEALQGAYLGLGSTYRTIGAYEQSQVLLQEAKGVFPKSTVYDVFLGMTLYNLDQHQEAMSLLLKVISQSQDPDIAMYQKAIAYYADHLDERW